MRLFIIYLFLAGIGFATVIRPAEPVLLQRAAAALESARAMGREINLTKWTDLERLPVDVQLAILGGYSERSKNITHYYSIIPESMRSKFPYGEVLLMSSTPLNVTAWYRAEIRTSSEEYRKALDEYDSLNPKDQLVRWYLVRNASGSYVEGEISEAELNKIMKDNGFLVPPPVGYHFNIKQLMADKTLSGSNGAHGEKQSSLTGSLEKSNALVKEDAAEQWDVLWWMVGGGILLLILFFQFLLRRKTKR